MERNNFEGASNSSKLDFHEISTKKGIVESKEKYVYVVNLHEIKMHP